MEGWIMKPFKQFVQEFCTIVFFLCAVGVIVFLATQVQADELDGLRDYPHPIICKPFVEKDGVVSMGEQETWVIVTWASLEDITETTLIFKNKDGVFYVPAKGFLCSQ
jgi:hypothetical protein